MKKINYLDTLPITMWLLVSIYSMFQFFLQTAASPIVKPLMHQLQTNATGIAIISSCFYYTYVTMQIPVGLIVDRFSARKVQSFTCFGLALTCFSFAFSHTFWSAFISRICQGFFSSFAFIGMLTVVRDWFPQKRFALMISLAEVVGMLGTAVCAVLLSFIVLHWGWRLGFNLCGIVVVILAVLLWFNLKDKTPELHNKDKMNNITPTTNILIQLKSILSNKQVWVCGIYGGLMMTVITIYCNLWGVPYFLHAYHYNLFYTSIIVSSALVGVAVGAPLFSILINYFACQKLMMIGSLFAGIIAFMLLYIHRLPYFILMLFSFIFGMMASTYLLTFSQSKKYVQTINHSGTMGFVNMLVMSSAAIFQPVIGVMLGKGHIEHHRVIYYFSDYERALVVLPLSFFLAFVLCFFMKENSEVMTENLNFAQYVNEV